MNKIFTKKVSFILLVIWLLIIFVFSNMNGDASDEISTTILYGLTNNTVFEKEVFSFLHMMVRKTAHVLEYFILSALLFSYLRFYITKEKRLFITVFILNFVCSCFDELHQLFIYERAGKLTDILIDSLGAIIFLIIIIIYRKNVTSRKSN